jgi:hypothetical protein
MNKTESKRARYKRAPKGKAANTRYKLSAKGRAAEKRCMVSLCSPRSIDAA